MSFWDYLLYIPRDFWRDTNYPVLYKSLSIMIISCYLFLVGIIGFGVFETANWVDLPDNFATATVVDHGFVAAHYEIVGKTSEWVSDKWFLGMKIDNIGSDWVSVNQNNYNIPNGSIENVRFIIGRFTHCPWILAMWKQ